MQLSTLLPALLLGAANLAAAQQTTAKGVEPSAAPAQLNVIKIQGCFSSAGKMESQGVVEFNTKDSCSKLCGAKNKPAGATTGGNECYCGDSYPPKSDLVDDKFCNVGCAGYDWEACGGIGYWTVYNFGVNLAVVNDGEPAITSGGKGSTAVVTVSGATVSVTASNTATGDASKPNTAAIAGGVVVGVVAVLGMVGGFFWFLRRRRNQEIEEEHRRNAAINSFVSGGKPPSSSGGWSNSDARLDPVMAQRRMSDGSIADNQDYSRKILRVTNA